MKKVFLPRTTLQQRQAALEFARRVREAMGRRILKVVLIGSVARGDFGSDSDIDIVVVAKGVDTDFKWEVWDIGAQVSLAHSVVLNVHIWSDVRWVKMQQQQNALWQNIERDGIDLSPELIPA